jgi:SLA1 Homology Domain 1 (SHD1) protein
MKGISSLGLRLFLTAILSAAMASIAVADDRFEIGDEVEVLILGQWQPGKVVNTNRQGAVLAEFSFAGGKNREILAPNFVRHECELGAVAPVREWQDASGKFEIRASVVQNDGKTVKLRKLDLEEIDVPVDALSKSNQRFLRGVKKGAAPMWPASKKSRGQDLLERTMEEMQERMSGRGRSPQPKPQLPKQAVLERFPICEQYGAQEGASADATDRVSLTPDPLPGYLALPNGGATVQDVPARVSAILPVGGPDGWLLAAIDGDSDASADAKPTRLVWVSLVRNRVEGQQWLPPGEFVVDYHAPSHRLLTRAWRSTYAGFDERKEDKPISIWEVLPTDSQVTPVVRWDPSVDKPKSSDARYSGIGELWRGLADGNTVIHQWERQEIVAWDIASKRMRYRIVRNLSNSIPPILSGGRKYLFVPEEDCVRIHDSLTGRVLSVLPTGHAVYSLALTDDGSRLAAAGNGVVQIWDLTDASIPPQEYEGRAMGGSLFRWQNNERLWTRASSSMCLYSLKHGAVLWSFQFPIALGSHAGHAYDVVRDHAVFAAKQGGMLDEDMLIGAIEIPGPEVDRADASFASFQPKSAAVIKPGSKVRIVVDAGEHNARVQAALESKVQENGWILDPNSSTVLTATMGREKPQQISYYSGNKLVETVTVTRHFSKLVLEHEGEMLLTWGTGDRAPKERYWLRGGETIQERIDAASQPNLEFFDQFRLPKTVDDPRKVQAPGVGTTAFTSQGLRVTRSPFQETPPAPK